MGVGEEYGGQREQERASLLFLRMQHRCLEGHWVEKKGTGEQAEVKNKKHRSDHGPHSNKRGKKGVAVS